MFFRKQLEKLVMVHPQYLGPSLYATIREQLLAEVEGTSQSDAGYIITVLDIKDDKGHGLIDHLSGFVKYRVVYNALMFRPFRNEVLDAVVKGVSDLGFFAEVGPLSVFVGRNFIPSDMAYIAEEMCYSSDERGGGGRIKAEHTVRLKIVNCSVLQSTLAAIGSINEPFLGVMD